MSIGISLSTSGIDARELVAAAGEAEQAGFDTIWVYDHLSGAVLSGRDRCLDVWSVLGAIASATSTVRLGPLVINTAVRHPAQIAVAAATVQDLSGGRLQLGLGAGANSPSPFAAELEMFHLPQFPAAARRQRVAETIGFLRALWRGDTDFTGDWSGFTDVRGVATPDPTPPIIVGANGPKMAAVAGALADGINAHHGDPALSAIIAIARDAAGQRPFRLTVEGMWRPDLLDPQSDQRAELASLGIDHLTVGWNVTLGRAAIRAAASHLR